MTNKNVENENKIKLPAVTRGVVFEIRVKGQLDDSWSDWFEGLKVKNLENGEMVLTGLVQDQAALMGILNKIYSLNLSLLSLNQAQKPLVRK